MLDQADFEIQLKLSFAVVRNMYVGKVFSSAEITSKPYSCDLSKFPNGMKVTLEEAKSGGEYKFEASAHNF